MIEDISGNWNLAAVIRTATEAQEHARACRKCWAPIVRDDEGNPGHRSEACAAGVAILDRWDAAERAYRARRP